jgi:hypothetical protein
MKKIYFTLITLFAATAINAQQLIPVPNDSTEASGTMTDGFDPFDIHLKLINNSNSTNTITWGLQSNYAPAQWGLGVCDNNNCYDLLIAAGPYVSLPIAAHDTVDMKMQYTSHCITGTGVGTIYVYVTGDSVNSLTHLTYTANLTANCGSGIAESSIPQLNIYPNPVKSSFLVTGLQDAGNVAFEVYDMKGATVTSSIKNASNNQIDISIESLAKGNYILKAFDAKGRVIGNARLSKID